MKEQYIVASEKYGFDITPLKSEVLGKIDISSGKVRIGDCYHDIENQRSKVVSVKNGSWLGKGFIRFNDIFLQGFIDDALKIDEKRNEIAEPFNKALAALSSIKDKDSSLFIKQCLTKELREKTSVKEISLSLNIFRDPEKQLRNRFFNRMSAIVIVHEDYQHLEAFSSENIVNLDNEVVGVAEINGSAIGIFDFQDYAERCKNIEELSDVYYLGSSSDYELLDKFGHKRKYAAQKIENSGFISSTGFGGGDFRVRVIRNSGGEVVLIHLNFVNDEDI